MIITLSGANDFLLKTELKQLLATFIGEYGEMGLERVDGEEAGFEMVQQSLQSLPFLASRKMVVLRAGSANKEFVEKAEELLAELPETTDVILLEPKLDKRSSFYKLLKKKTDFREFSDLDKPQLMRWLVKTAKDMGVSLALTDANYLIDRIGSGQQLLASELEKLALYNPQITRPNIELLTDATPQSKIFDLLDAAFAGNQKRMLQLYDEQRAQKVEPQQIIAMLAWQLHVLALIKTAGSRSADQIARKAKLSPFVANKNQAVARRLSLAELKRVIANLLSLDGRLKREAIDADEALKHYLLELAG